MLQTYTHTHTLEPCYNTCFPKAAFSRNIQTSFPYRPLGASHRLYLTGGQLEPVLPYLCDLGQTPGLAKRCQNILEQVSLDETAYRGLVGCMIRSPTVGSRGRKVNRIVSQDIYRRGTHTRATTHYEIGP